ncbi:unnamed protein product [Durusdinium trenchii]|uniref:Potassium/sodium hyperpolarization-activated cyclic nucleotide-gated channel 1 n=2 Tax=Durusdinium trenchii TaxID=1381693 RepID=A0ABP0L6X1_9DINO
MALSKAERAQLQRLLTGVGELEESRPRRRFVSSRTKMMMLRSPIHVSELCHRLQTFPFFSNSHRDFLSLLSRELDIRIFHPGQTVLREGEYGEMTYILVHGEVEVMTEQMALTEGSTPIRIKAPNIFGESPLLLGAPARRTATVIARAICDARMVHQRIFNQLLSHFPDEKSVYKKMAKDRYGKRPRTRKTVSASSNEAKDTRPPSVASILEDPKMMTREKEVNESESKLKAKKSKAQASGTSAMSKDLHLPPLSAEKKR